MFHLSKSAHRIEKHCRLLASDHELVAICENKYLMYKHFEGIKDLRKKLEQAMTATDGFGRDARSIMNTLSNIKDPQQVKETLEENSEKIKVLK